MGVEGGEPVPMELNSMLPQIVNTGCEAFEAQWKNFSIERVLDLDSSVGEVPLAEHDFGEAIVNLVSNACYSMLMKLEEEGANYQPVLRISSRLYEDDNLVEGGCATTERVSRMTWLGTFSTHSFPHVMGHSAQD